MTCLGPGECTLEAVRFATGSYSYTRDTFGLAPTGPVSIKDVVRGAMGNKAVPFTFVKQKPTTWAGLMSLPWGIYVGRVKAGAHHHMIAYDSWRHLLFLGGGRVVGGDRVASRGWYITEDEVDHPAAFERFMMDLLGDLWKNIDAIYRVDVHAQKLAGTSYC